MKIIVAITGLISFFTVLSVDAGDNMKAFPPPDKGQIRFVIDLPRHDDESNYKVQLIAGKTVAVDEKNQYFFGGRIQKETIKGWGFPRYVLSELGPMAGTLMAIDPNAPKVDRFIGLGGEPYLIRYNSRLPIVIYTPEGAEVRYRIWNADLETKEAEAR
jgi:ecotin